MVLDVEQAASLSAEVRSPAMLVEALGIIFGILMTRLSC